LAEIAYELCPPFLDDGSCLFFDEESLLAVEEKDGSRGWWLGHDAMVPALVACVVNRLGC
jgi:hypothetical protein